MRYMEIKGALRAAAAFSAGFSALALAAPAWAQDAGDQRDDSAVASDDQDAAGKEIVVTGFAASLQRAIENKRNLDVISDGIAAEDIGKYPEQNIAESLQRVTGVQISRNLGEGQFLSVRGLDPKFTNTLYNGRQLPSGSGTRAFDFQVLSANFASQVDVYKSPTADMLESGLAATVNMQSIRPLAVGKRRVAITAEGTYDEQARGSMRPHISALYTDTFLDNRLGFSIAIDVNKRNLDDQQFVTEGVLQDSTWAGPDTRYRVFAVHQNDMVGDDERISATSALQFKATDSLELYVDTIVSQFDQRYNYFQGNQWYAGAGALGPSPTDSVTVDGNGVETAWRGSNVFAWTQSNRFAFKQSMWSSAFGARYDLGGWKVDAEGSYGKATERTTQTFVSWATKSPGASMWYDTTVDPDGPISFGFYDGFDPTDPSHYYFFGVQGTYKQPTTDKVWNGRIDVTREVDLGLIRAIRFGGTYQDRTLATTPNAMPASAAGFPADMSPYLFLYDNPTYFKSYDGPAEFPRSFLTVDLDKFFHDFPMSEIVKNNPPTQVLSTTTKVQERSGAGYVRLDLASDNSRLRGNVGLRYVVTQEASSGFIPTPDAKLVYGFFGANTLGYTDAALQAQKFTYRNLLPSLNLAYQVGNDIVVRFAAAKVMQRPDMNLLAAASSPSAPTVPPPDQPWRGNLNLGNPALKPYLANQFDLSFEWYVGKRGLLAAAVFAKDVKNLVLTSYYDMPAVVTQSDGSTRPITLAVAQPKNTEKATVKGIEAGFQQALDFLPGPLSHLGIQVNYTHIWSDKVVLNQGQPALPLTGISKNTYNITGYYDDGRFSIHAGYNYRSRWVQDPLSFFGDGSFVNAYGQLDMSSSYRITDKISVLASVANVTQAGMHMVNKYDITRYYGLSGRRFNIGVRASF
ncbi:TonB-dependent receptor [Hephaestia sp. GCM10023244]|uniref:TonB-dependent receptor n=1 Tax=unclassified Hephaestia TaxID=2631281 RepID=UPI0020775F41|nr:TonB-dependent receptor [Hephaestia sp. MAHUQ-44]MCM8730284.1 TonB-dependent receptor [Hephaestia sp. MAHUQ-44]